ncbi:MAG TPA: hypothetical protein VEY50_07405 [Lysobacter sp.]|nr:hypothetical protein [Lysobacter sp.]
MPEPAPVRAERPRPASSLLWSWLLLALGAAGMVAAWVVVGLWNGRANGWMALLAALDMAWVLRLGGWRPGPARALIAAVATLAIALAANWGAAAAQLSGYFGVDPLQSVAQLGARHAWTLAQLANGPADVAALMLGVLLAALAAR